MNPSRILPTADWSRAAMHFFGIAWMVVAPQMQGAEGIGRVALPGFTCSESSYGNVTAAQNLAAAVQAELLKDARFEWVERAEIDRAEAELQLGKIGALTTGTMLRTGAWLKADHLITGRLTTVPASALQLEVIDLKHADIVGAANLPLPATTAEMLSQETVVRIAQRIRELLDGVQSARGPANRVILAPLFFRNVDPAGRLDFFENDLQEAFRVAGRASERVRVLQFPRAQESRTEAELSLLGLSDADPQAWQRLADFHVWGTFAEVKASEVPFPQVSVKVEINLWSPHGLTRLEEQGKVADLPALARRLVQRVFDQAAKPTEIGAPATREELARQLYDRAQEVITVNFDGSIFAHSDAWRRRRHYAMQLLEIACFFDPANVRAERELLLEKWRDDVTHDGRKFFAQLECAADWKRHYEKFGFNYEEVRFRERAEGRMSDNRAPSANNESTLVRTELDILESLASPWFKEQTPGVPEAVRIRWKREHEEEFAVRIDRARQSNPTKLNHLAGHFLYHALDVVGDVHLRVRLVEALFPLIAPKSFSPEGALALSEKIQRAYAATGKPAPVLELAPLTQDARPMPEPKTKPVSANLDAIAMPPKLEVDTRWIGFGDDYLFHGVLALGWHGGELWVSTTGAEIEPPEMASAVWRYQAGEKRPRRQRGEYGSDPQVVQFINGPANTLWLAFAASGVWRVDAATGKVQKFGGREGLASPIAMTGAAAGDRLFVGGGEEGRGTVSVFDSKQGTWSELALDFKPAGRAEGPGQVKHLAAFGDWLFVSGDARGSSNYAYLYDFPRRRWTDVDALCFPVALRLKMLPPQKRDARLLISSATSDGSGFLVGSRAGLMRLRPEAGRAADLAVPTGPAGGEVTAMVHDGDHLWVAAYVRRAPNVAGTGNTLASHLFVLHKPSRKWVGHIPMPGKGFVSALAVSPFQVWVGFDADLDTTLLEIAKPTLP